jgi:hypothetical protein
MDRLMPTQTFPAEPIKSRLGDLYSFRQLILHYVMHDRVQPGVFCAILRPLMVVLYGGDAVQFVCR